MSSNKLQNDPRNGRIITFYSYKGGVGRSMALANIGVILAQGTEAAERPVRVLLIDWDLEAPGLEKYFKDKPQVKLTRSPETTLGVVDLIIAKDAGEPIDWHKCIVKAEIGGASVDLITSGKHERTLQSEKSYAQRVQGLNWPELFEKADIGRYFDQLRNEWIAEYDFILVDSRTGITDIGDICTVILPDILVPLFVTNRQNIDGVKKIAQRARKARQSMPVDRTHLLIVPVPSRRENAEYDEYANWERITAEELGDFFDDWLPQGVQPIDALRRIAIPYVPKWSFGERLPIIEGTRELGDPSSIGAAFSRIASLLESNLDWNNRDWNDTSEREQLRADLFDSRKEKETSEQKRKDLELEAERIKQETTAEIEQREAKLSQELRETKRRLRLSLISAVSVVSAVSAIYVAIFESSQSKLAEASRMETTKILEMTAAQLSDTQSQIRVSNEASLVYETVGAGVQDAHFSPDGRTVLTTLDDGTTRIWDVGTAEELMLFERVFGRGISNYRLKVLRAVFSPDGTSIATTEFDGLVGTIRMWDVNTGAQIGRPMRGHEDVVNSVSYSPDGTRIVSGSEDGTLRIWDVATGEQIWRSKGENEDAVSSVAFSPDGARIVSGSRDGTLQIWDGKTGAPIGNPMSGHEAEVLSVAFSPDGLMILSGSSDRTARLWDSNFGAPIGAPILGQKGAITSVAFSPDGIRIVTASTDGTARVWNALNGSSITRIAGSDGPITSAEFSPDGQSILTGSLDGTFRITQLQR